MTLSGSNQTDAAADYGGDDQDLFADHSNHDEEEEEDTVEAPMLEGEDDQNGTAEEDEDSDGSLAPFPNRDELPVADLTDLYVKALIPTVTVTLLLLLCALFVFCCKCPGTSILGLSTFTFLVLSLIHI